MAKRDQSELSVEFDQAREGTHNNISERTLRSQAIGRRNWLFLGHKLAGPRAAVLFTILAVAKPHHLEPWAYLTDVLDKLAAETADLDARLPNHWATTHPKHILADRLEEACQTRARQKAKRIQRRKKRQ